MQRSGESLVFVSRTAANAPVYTIQVADGPIPNQPAIHGNGDVYYVNVERGSISGVILDGALGHGTPEAAEELAATINAVADALR